MVGRRSPRRATPVAALTLVALLAAGCTLGPIPTRTPVPTAPATPSPSPTVAPTPSPSPTPAPLAVESVAQVVVAGLRLRNAPAADAAAVAVLQAGQRVVITDGPRQADGFIWYEVSRGRDAARGWLAAVAADGTPWLKAVGNGRIAIRYAEGERTGIGLVDADGGNLVVLEGTATGLAWSPDGSRLAFSLANALDPASAPEIFVAGADGSERHRIGRGSAFAWSPDGSRVAIAEPNRIILHDPEDGQDIGRLPLPLTSVSELTWSPNGSALALSAAGPDSGRDVYVVASDTGKLTRLTGRGVNDSPSWSPSGNRLVFNTPDGVVLSDADGADERKLSDGRIAAPWSPDGIFLLIARYGGLDLFDLRLQGSQTVARDDDSSTVSAGTWSPDGLQIVYRRTARGAGGATQTFVAQRDGSEAHALPGTTSDLAAWQPVLGTP
jgi:dipeptidyl aminopeptidase/acylaminoacyl peptidase